MSHDTQEAYELIAALRACSGEDGDAPDVSLCMRAAYEIDRLVRLLPRITDETVCCSCGRKEGLEWGPDPYADEIGHDDTPVWECGPCRDESARDI